MPWEQYVCKKKTHYFIMDISTCGKKNHVPFDHKPIEPNTNCEHYNCLKNQNKTDDITKIACSTETLSVSNVTA